MVQNKTGESEVCKSLCVYLTTVMILNFWTDMFVQTEQTQIRLLLQAQSDQGFHYLLFQFHHLGILQHFLTSKFEF